MRICAPVRVFATLKRATVVGVCSKDLPDNKYCKETISGCALTTLTMSTDRKNRYLLIANSTTTATAYHIQNFWRSVDLPSATASGNIASKAENTKKLLQIDSDSNDNNPDEEASGIRWSSIAVYASAKIASLTIDAKDSDAEISKDNNNDER
uniref:Uncharacterized protein n=1 Tax=Glossina austeni TaxID=7395 RepID=A0A1A9VVR7_GLOAU